MKTADEILKEHTGITFKNKQILYPAIIKAMNEYKLQTITKVLIDFATELQNIGFNEMDSVEKVVTIYLKDKLNETN